MKKLFVFLLIVCGSLAVTTAHAQVRVNAHVRVGNQAAYERDYPGYTYYSYPAWRGHYRDRYYYAHYRPVFEREHRGYFRGRRFDNNRFERDYHRHGDRWQRRH